jgi:MFS family permease
MTSSALPIARNTALLSAALAGHAAMLSLTAAVASITLVRVLDVEWLLGLGPAVVLTAGALAAVPAGRGMDRLGRVPVLVAGFGVGAAGCGLAALGSARGSALAVLAGLAGVGTASGATLLARTAAGDMYPPQRRAHGIALVLFGAVFGASTMSSGSLAPTSSACTRSCSWSATWWTGSGGPGVWPSACSGWACPSAGLLWVESVHATAAALFGLGLGWNLSFVAAMAVLADRTRPWERGSLLGFNDLLSSATGAGLVLVGGLVLTAAGVASLTIGAVALLAAPALWILVASDSSRRSS